MLMPRRVKHRKQHHPKRRGTAKGGTSLAFGDFGIQAIEGAVNDRLFSLLSFLHIGLPLGVLALLWVFGTLSVLAVGGAAKRLRIFALLAWIVAIGGEITGIILLYKHKFDHGNMGLLIGIAWLAMVSQVPLLQEKGQTDEARSVFAGIAGALAAINFEIANSAYLGAVQSGTVLFATYIGGIGLAKGYWRDSAKTAASRITPSPAPK